MNEVSAKKNYTLGFFTNPERAKAILCLREALGMALSRGYACCINDETKEKTGVDAPSFKDLRPDVILAFGGDGTILHAAEPAHEYGVPILGVNLGRVGFLSEISPEALGEALDRIDAGNYSLDARMLLACSVNGGPSRLCLNEALLYKRSFSGVVDISMEIDGIDAGCVLCDGIIVSTSTGATGYSISAGGPVIAPGLDAIIVTPICPHTLSVRPIIASGASNMRFSMNSEGYVSLDGIHSAEIDTDDVLTVRRSDKHVDFIRFGTRNIYSLIRSRLS
ncbi:MAG TPA: NAD(+)/NADH kinase [Clostridia bacterium]|nr:NAD(+)/NADH kinase [Clostridia bacterium]